MTEKEAKKDLIISVFLTRQSLTNTGIFTEEEDEKIMKYLNRTIAQGIQDIYGGITDKAMDKLMSLSTHTMSAALDSASVCKESMDRMSKETDKKKAEMKAESERQKSRNPKWD